MVDKDMIKAAQEACAQEAELAMQRGLDFVALANDPRSAIADFEKAGALLAAAAHLKDRKA